MFLRTFRDSNRYHIPRSSRVTMPVRGVEKGRYQIRNRNDRVS